MIVDAIARANQSQGLAGLSSIYQSADGQANANLGTANQAAPPFWQQALMSGMQDASAAAPTIGGAFGIKPPCYIAAALYNGWDAPETLAIRQWLLTDVASTSPGRWLVRLYAKHGEALALRMRTNRPLRAFFRVIFAGALRMATRECR